MTETGHRLDAIRQRPDVSVLIVGGGIIGAGLFRDLALQGVDVLLVDRSDFCSGTSAAPSRMIHGGLRYLEFGEFKLVKESVRERNLLLLNAPHYVRPLPTTIPLVKTWSGLGSVIRRILHLPAGKRAAHRGSVMAKIGLTLYDILGRKYRSMPKHSFASRREAFAARPLLNPDTIRTATYYDAWISYPERLCLELLMDGEELCEDAKAVSYVSLEGASGDSVRLRDEPSGEILEVRPAVLVNATGAWIDFTNRLMGRETEMIGGTKGAHLVLDNDALLESLNGQMVFYETPDGRVSVALPWLGKPLIGSTDIRVEDPDQARCGQEEIDYMLGAIREAFPKLEIDRSQILSAFSGIRPLGRSGGATVTVSRAHQCRVVEPGDGTQFPIYCMVGGKWTPFRAFAQHVTDMLMEHFGRARREATEELAIGGGKDYPGTDEASDRWLTALRERTNLDRDRLLVLLERYGTRAEQVAAFCVDGPDGPLRHHERYTRREIEFIVRRERVIHLDDIVLRRTSIALLGQLTADLLDELAQIAAASLGWSPDQIRREMDRTREILLDRHRIEL